MIINSSRSPTSSEYIASYIASDIIGGTMITCNAVLEYALAPPCMKRDPWIDLGSRILVPYLGGLGISPRAALVNV